MIGKPRADRADRGEWSEKIGHDLARHLPAWWSVAALSVVITGAVVLLWKILVDRAAGSLGYVPLEVILPALAVPLLIAYVVTQSERLWLYVAMLSFAAFSVRGDEGGFGLDEVVFVSVVFGGMVAWYLKELVVYRRRIVETSFDVLLMTTWVLANVVALVAATIYDADPVIYLKEFLGLSPIMLYFPARKALRTRKDLVMMLWVVAGLALINGAMNVAMYQEKVLRSAMEFGAVNARAGLFEPLSVTLAVVSFTALAYARTVRGFTLFLAGTAIGSALVAISLSRSFMVGTVLAFLVVMSLLPWRRALRLAVIMVITAGVNVGALVLIAPTFAQSILDNLEDRVSTLSDRETAVTTAGGRTYEAEALIERYIPESVILGHGFGVPYGFVDKSVGFNVPSHYMHNGYLYPFYKFGLPVGILFLILLVWPLKNVMYDAPARHAGFSRGVLAASVALLVAMLITNLTSSKFYQHVDMALFALIWVGFDFAARRARHGDLPEEIPPPRHGLLGGEVAERTAEPAAGANGAVGR